MTSSPVALLCQALLQYVTKMAARSVIVTVFSLYCSRKSTSAHASSKVMQAFIRFLKH